MEMTKLSLVTNEELLDELQSRFDHGLFIAVKNFGTGKGQVTIDKRGLYFAIIGLIDYAYDRVKRKEAYLNDEEDL